MVLSYIQYSSKASNNGNFGPLFDYFWQCTLKYATQKAYKVRTRFSACITCRYGSTSSHPKRWCSLFGDDEMVSNLFYFSFKQFYPKEVVVQRLRVTCLSTSRVLPGVQKSIVYSIGSRSAAARMSIRTLSPRFVYGSSKISCCTLN